MLILAALIIAVAANGSYTAAPLASATTCPAGKGLAYAGINGPPLAGGAPFRICVTCAVSSCADCVSNPNTQYPTTSTTKISYQVCNTCNTGYFAVPPAVDPTSIATPPAACLTPPVVNECVSCRELDFHCNQCGPTPATGAIQNSVAGNFATCAVFDYQCSKCDQGYAIAKLPVATPVAPAPTGDIAVGASITNQCVTCSALMPGCVSCHNDPANTYLPVCDACESGLVPAQVVSPGVPAATASYGFVLSTCVPGKTEPKKQVYQSPSYNSKSSNQYSYNGNSGFLSGLFHK